MPPYLSVVRSLALLPILALPVSAKEKPTPNNLFTLSGFVVKFGDTPERLAVLRSLPANKLVARTRGRQDLLRLRRAERLRLCICRHAESMPGTAMGVPLRESGTAILRRRTWSTR